MGKTNQLGVLADVFTSDASNNVGIGAAPSGSYKLEVTGTAKVSGATYLASGGAANVGIGTTTANAALDIAVDAAVLNYPRIYDSRTQAADRGAKLNLGGYSDSLTTITSFGQIVGAKTNATSGNTSGYLSFLTNNGTSLTEKLRITDTGNVGIGLSSPIAKLQVYGIDSTTSSLSDVWGSGVFRVTPRPNSSDAALMITNAGTTTVLGISAASSSTTALPLALNPYGGNVLIGTTTVTGANSMLELLVGSTREGLVIKLASSAYSPIMIKNTSNVTMFSINESNVGYLNAAAWSYGSDARIKENINYIETGLDKILALKPATFDYIDGVKNNIGWIAQDVQKVIPEAVTTLSETNDQLTLKSDYIVPYLVKAIQELSQQNQDLKSRLDKAGL